MILYHYTTKEGHDEILRTQVLLPSLRASNPKDARHGDGQYLSDIPPRLKRPGQLSYLFLNIPYQGRRFAYYIGLNVDGLNPIKGREYVWVIPNQQPLDISGRVVSHGENK
jgi:hypothetical protein